jgi:hypothetical protein
MRRRNVVRVLLAIVLMTLFASVSTVRPQTSADALPDWQPYVDAGTAMALALTTIDYRTVDRDIQRILDNATDPFYDDFQKRAVDFAQVVRQSQSTSTGTITEARLESQNDGQARVFVAVTVTTANAGVPHPEPRLWRILITVQKVGDAYKASNVEFLP